jgi:hypothetical protein
MNLPRTSFARMFGAPRELAAGSARLLRTASPQTLEHLLRSPARRLVLDAIFWHVARQLRRSGSSRPNGTIRCHVISGTGAEPETYELRLNGGRCELTRGAGEDTPHVTVALDDAELVRLITTGATPAQEVLGGRIMVRGRIRPLASALASRLLSQLKA